ncbi:glycosyltransferase [Halobacillus sp. SY10]|uniref:glycosyltransferase n=1 Tax=Halobacillus sp. SY10 TaxID=3381356 RepID=UPI003879CA64
MKILIISTQFPYPKDNGKKVILSSIYEYFIEKHGENSIEYIVVGDNDLKKSLNSNVIYIDKPKVLNQLKNVFFNTLIFRNKSLQESFLFSNDIKKTLVNYIDEKDIDLVIYDTLRISQYFEDEALDVEEFVYMDDLFSIRYEKMLHNMKKFKDVDFNVLGNFSSHLPKFAKRISSIQSISKLLLKYEKGLLKKRELVTAEKITNKLLISELEVGVLKANSKQENIRSIRPKVLNHKNNITKRDYKGVPTFIFLGSLNIPHNNVSIVNFIKVNMKNLISENPNVKLKIIGKNPSNEVLKLTAEYPKNIELSGYVENLDKLFNESCAMIIPLLFGSGVKLKTLEAMSRALPVITTNFGAEGINLPMKGECIVENDISKFPVHMSNLTNISTNRKMSNLAHRFFYEYYSKEAVYRQYDNIFSMYH